MLDVWQKRLERLKANRWFELFVVAIIILSALLIGAHTYSRMAGIFLIQLL